MRKKALIFNGDYTTEIEVDYFFQHPVIEKLEQIEVFLYYQATAVYASTVRSIFKLSKEERVKLGYEVEPDYLEKLNKGEDLLKQMVIDLFPNIGEKMVAEVIKIIKEEENEEV